MLYGRIFGDIRNFGEKMNIVEKETGKRRKSKTGQVQEEKYESSMKKKQKTD